MEKNKILTVVVPAYNIEKYLDRCLLSLTCDENILGDIEIIVVNDGSTDNSLSIARKYERRNPESIIVVDKENGGHGSTINLGLKIASGKYFRVVDSDDWVNIDDFSEYVKRLKSLDTDVVLTNYTREMVYNGTKSLSKYKGLSYEHIYDLNKMDPKIWGDGYFYMATSTMKTQKLRDAKLQLDEHTFYVDMEYNIFPLAHLSTFIYLDLDIYRYWIGRPQQSMDARILFKNRSHHEKVMKRLVIFFSEEKLGKNKTIYVRKILTLMLNTHYFIYCSQPVPRAASKEVRAFDAWLKKINPELYNCVAVRFPYIDAHRKTRFIFTHFLPTLFRKYTNRLYTVQSEAEDLR